MGITPKKEPLPSLPDSDRALRIITILTFEPALALLIPHGVFSHRICPALGLVPMFLSVCVGLIQVLRRIKTRSIDSFVDAFLAAFLLSILIPGFVNVAESRRLKNGLLGAYGTMPLIINFCIHCYFAARQPMFSSFEKLSNNVMERFKCPHCRGPRSRGANWRHAAREGSIHSDESEERYRDDPEEGGISEPVETASVTSSRLTARQDIAPLFKAPPEEDQDAAVLV